MSGHQLRYLLNQPGTLILPGVYDCLGAKLAAQVGFEAVFTSGFGISASTLGLPDYGLLTATETLQSVGKMAESISIPLVADLDTGYGNPLNVMRTVTEALRWGVSGIILEDQVWPKKCGHFQGKQVISAAEQVEKIKAAVHARGESGLVIVGRTDARAPLGLEEAIDRGRLYAEAGADIIFIEAPQSVEELVKISNSFARTGVHLFANLIEGGKTPCLRRSELQELGFKVGVYALSGLFAATQAMRECFERLRAEGTTGRTEDDLSFPEFEQIIGVDRYRQLEERFKIPGESIKN
ncbi:MULTISPECIES: oxaloacetate decarboxylase [unclassified Roseofilum]|uniref:isocitrate lyase/PEP mutase family protein n=1 Tax=unclassified Roseofilum TaxID=2620099 RepID=UPI000E88C758|nr:MULTISPECIES: oxaloacetate decarboxylase [unclassified Roseofilum]MBP0009969.1 oxaloacetate decarboxylase [Roseofilum sp. Belize Diploria]MBP0034365.1 oxaloacetate decarboxylase [Roseofilum sp. Belize BBD 4]HBQ99753.1 carboxyvinyl-carboxyphosphonate phosphorylmutase [Cyanobacteria bacterium UBA11691]